MFSDAWQNDEESLLEQEKLVDLVVGPDAYRDIPNLVDQVRRAKGGQRAAESRGDLRGNQPGAVGFEWRYGVHQHHAGLRQHVQFLCGSVHPGRERSQDPESIVREAHELFEAGYREVTLLGQNVDSYKWNIDNKGNIKNEGEPVVRFAELLERVAAVNPDLRVRFRPATPRT